MEQLPRHCPANVHTLLAAMASSVMRLPTHVWTKQLPLVAQLTEETQLQFRARVVLALALMETSAIHQQAHVWIQQLQSVEQRMAPNRHPSLVLADPLLVTLPNIATAAFLHVQPML